MPLTPEQRDAVVNELKSFGTSLNLSDEQKQRLQGFMTEASEQLQDYKQQNPNASKEDLLKRIADNRASIQRLVSFLTTHEVGRRSIES